MPINNTIKLPYYLKILVDKHLVDIDVPPAAVSKKEPLKPADVTLKFPTKDTVLKVVLVRFIQSIPTLASSPRYQINADDLQQKDSLQLRITGFQHLRRLTPEAESDGLKARYKEELTKFQIEYMNLARGHLKKRLDENKDILSNIREFDREDFIQTYTSAQTFEEVSNCHIDLENMLAKAVTVLTAQPQPMSPHSATVEPTTQRDPSRRGSLTQAPSVQRMLSAGSLTQAPSVKRMMSAPPSINMHTESPRSGSPDHKSNSDDEDGSPSLLNEMNEPNDDKREVSQLSPSRASSNIPRYSKVFSSTVGRKIEEGEEEEAKVVINRGEFNEEFKDFLREIQKDPLPKGATLPEDLATHCSLTGELCQIPVIVNHKRYNFSALTKLPGFTEAPYFMDPSGTNKRIYKFDIHADPESRKTTLIRLAKKTFFEEFIHNHNAAYADAGFFKQSNFRTQHKKGLIKDFDDLVMFIVANPSSRSAKIFVGMTTLPIDDPLVNFLRNTFLPDYQGAWFKRSNFLEKIMNKEIKTYEDAEAYANFNADTRTARLMRR